IVGKMGGEAMSHLNNSSGSVEPTLYYPGQKRPGEDGGEADQRTLLTSLTFMFISPGSSWSQDVRSRSLLAKRLLVQIVERCRNGPGFHGDGDGGTSVQEMLIPASKVGLVIGRGGDTIKQLQERAGVKMMMIQDGPMPTGADKPLRISGDPYKVQIWVFLFFLMFYS
ncbi:hypothetical protein GOODEAATRI_020822, partial [Goodea atripinnis]